MKLSLMVTALKLIRLKDNKENHLFYQNYWNKRNANEKAINQSIKEKLKIYFFSEIGLDMFNSHLSEAKEIL